MADSELSEADRDRADCTSGRSPSERDDDSSHDMLTTGVAPSHPRTVSDCRARDIRRRVDVIQKKLVDLQELGIPCAFCYSSVRNTGSLFTLGDKRITDVIEAHKNDILNNLEDQASTGTDAVSKEIHLILPPLPAPMEELSRATMQTLVVGILKDLGLRWSDPKPKWWPLDVPFVSPRSVHLAGNWTQALKKVIECVYSYFSYDVNSYISGSLGSARDANGESEREEEEEGETDGERERERVEGDTGAASSKKKVLNRLENGTMSPLLSPPVPPLIRSVSNSAVNSVHRPPPLALLGAGTASRRRHGSESAANESDSRRGTDNYSPRPTSSSSAQKTAAFHPRNHNHQQRLSSFTVENILMGQRPPTSPAALSPSLSPQTPLYGSMPYQTPPGWRHVTHPQVKYTKFTLLSPASMSGDRKRSSDSSSSSDAREEPVVGHRPKRDRRDSQGIFSRQLSNETPQGSAGKSDPLSDTQTACKALLSLGSDTVAETSHQGEKLVGVAPPGDAATSQSVPVIQTAPAGPREGFPTSVVAATHPTDSTPNYGFPPSHRYIIVLPPHCVAVSAAPVPTDRGGAEAMQLTSSPQGGVQILSPATVAAIPTMLVNEPPPLVSSHTHTQPIEDTAGGSKWSYVPIAPKSGEKPTTVRDAVRLQPKDAPKDSPPPRKLRFHMTSVVHRMRRVCSDGSDRMRRSPPGMTTPPPSMLTVGDRSLSGSIVGRATEEGMDIENTRDDGADRLSSLVSSAAKREASAGQPSQPTVLKNSSLSLQRINPSHSPPPDSKLAATAAPPGNGRQVGSRGRGRGNSRRGYTRRKRELTFHLYESPSTAVRSRRSSRSGQ